MIDKIDLYIICNNNTALRLRNENILLLDMGKSYITPNDVSNKIINIRGIADYWMKKKGKLIYKIGVIENIEVFTDDDILDDYACLVCSNEEEKLIDIESLLKIIKNENTESN